MKLKRRLSFALSSAALCVTLMQTLTTHDAGAQTSTAAPPPTRAEALKETLHGVEVEDPYRWLETDESEEVRAWTDAQNAHTRAALDAVQGRAALQAEMERALRRGELDAPEPRGRRLFYTRRDSQQNQPALYVREGLKGTDRALVDPNTFSAEGTTALDWWNASSDGRLLAYGLSSSGDEISTLHVLDVETGKDLNDRIERARAASVASSPRDFRPRTPRAFRFYFASRPKRGTARASQSRSGSKRPRTFGRSSSGSWA